MIYKFKKIDFIFILFIFALLLYPVPLRADNLYYDKYGNEISEEEYNNITGRSTQEYDIESDHNKVSTSKSFERRRTFNSRFSVEEGPYVSGYLGSGVISDSEVNVDFTGTFDATFDPGLALKLGLGHASEVARVEGEIGYISADIDEFDVPGASVGVSGDVSALSLMLNVFADFKTTSSFTPYVGGGIGFARVSVSKTKYDSTVIFGADDDTVFSYQLGIGLGIIINEKVTIDIGYRLFMTTDPQFEVADTEFKSHLFLAGVRLAFDETREPW